jgi:DNA polymerase-3 subunit alpha
LVDAAIKEGMPGIAITDYGNMFGIMEFVDYVSFINKKRKRKKETPFKPIIGCELYVAKHGPKEKKEGMKDIKGYHLTVLAKSLQGYKNLVKIVSNSWTEGFYVAPRTDRKDLEKYHEGLIVLSGGWGSEVFTHINNEDMTALEDTIKWYKQIFGADYYLEMRRETYYDLSKDAPSNLMLEEEKANQVLIQKSKEFGVKVVATNDVRCAASEDYAAYKIQQCIVAEKTLEEYDTGPLRFRWVTGKDFMTELFSNYPEAISNTMEIFDKVEFYDIQHKLVMPPFTIPEGFQSDADYLEYLTYTKAKLIYGDPIPEEVEDRLQFELEIIEKKGAEKYFLFIQDIVNTAEKELGVLVGPGRGATAGSLAAYCLGITKIDPLKHDLLFERFMCPDKRVIPDIDLDFDEEGRARVIEWLEKKYGKEYCAHIVILIKSDTKTAFESIAHVCQLPASTSKAINKDIDYYWWMPMNFNWKIKNTPGLRKLLRSAGGYTLEHNISVLEDTIQRMVVNPLGFIVSESPISDWAPICALSVEGKTIRCTQYDFRTVEETGLMKFVFLGEKTLTQLKMICERIKAKGVVDFDINKIPIDDPKTFELFQQGNTEDIFNFDIQGMQHYLRKLHPTTFKDLVILNVMYRPGVKKHLLSFINRKNGKWKTTYAIPVMEKYLQETYGIVVYQEQVMMLSRLLADFTRGESDTLCKALGKKKANVLSVLKQKFIEGGLRNGHNRATLEKIWKEWEEKGKYAINKAHVVCLTWLAYQMAYLKAHYPEEFKQVIEKYSSD